MHPNPARNELFIYLPDDAPKDVALLDLSGRRVRRWSAMTARVLHVSTDHCAKGVYYVQVSNESVFKTKKLIIE